MITSGGGGASASLSIAENETAVTTVTSTDVDGGTSIYSIAGGADAARFNIDSSSGVLSFASAPNYESPTDSGGNNVYDVTVQVADGNGGTDTQAVAVTIIDVDEFDVGAISDTNAAANSVNENVANGTAVGITASASDADATTNAITYSLDDSAGGRFAIHSTTGVVTVNAALDCETATSHSVTIRATSSDGSFSTQSFSIAVTDVNESGITAISDADAAADLVLENAVNGTVVGLTALADDTDGTDTVSYALDDDASGRFAIHATTGVVTVAGGINRESAGSYDITVRATSSDTTTTTRTFTITIGDVDEFDVSAPTDTNGSANVVNENAANGTVVGITASASDADATTNAITYSLDDSAGGRFAINGSTGVVTVADGTLLNREVAASHNITVCATSADGSFSTQAFTININDVDEFDVGVVSDSDAAANAVNENAANGTVVGITASASDADATTNAITYSLDDSAGGRFAINGSTGVLTVADGTLLDREVAASHSITVRATSADGSFSTQAFTININDVDEFDVAAVTDANAAANAVDENAANGIAVGITAAASDADATTNAITYSLDDSGGGRFAINGSTGVVTVADGTLLDREVAGSHNITIRATSADGSFSTQTFTINVNDVDEFDVGAVTDSDVAVNTVAENAGVGTTVGLTGLASDADATAAVSYSLDDDAGGRFAIHSTTGVVTVNAALDYETATSHSVTICATSSDGSFSTQSFSIAVTDVNESGITAISDTDAAADLVLENAVNGTVVGLTALADDTDGTDTVSYALDDDASGRFAIHATTGVVTVAGGINRESAGSYDITVRATSSDTTTTTRTFTITIGDVDEFDVSAPTDTNGSANVVNENAANGTVVGITASASDADATTNAITYSLDDSAGGRFAINGSTGVVTVADGTLLNREVAASHNITIRATSADGSFSTQTLTINVNDVDEFDVGAVTDSNAAANTVAENAGVGTAVGLTGLANDADATATISYSLDDDAGGRFAIDGTTGVVTINATLDYETATNHSVTVRATSSDGSFSTQSYSIAVTDVNESGITAISDTDAAADLVLENAVNGTVVGLTALADDTDGTDTVSYALDDDASGRFAMHATTGVVTVAGGINREVAGSYDITVRATSSDTTTTTRTFTITIGDVDEFDVSAPTDTNGSANAVNENAANGTAVGITASAIDADATTNAITYSLDDSAGGRFAINGSTGVVTVADGTLLDREVAAAHNITVRATSADGSSSTQSFTISVNDVDEFDVGAVTDSDVAVNTVAENAGVGTAVGLTGLASDADATATVTYSLDNDAGGRFAIHGTTGVVTINGAGLRDGHEPFGHRSSHQFGRFVLHAEL